MRFFIKLFFLLLFLSFPITCGEEESKCKVDYDCEEGLVCNKTTGKCEIFVCKIDSDCVKPELKCVNNACIEIEK